MVLSPLKSPRHGLEPDNTIVSTDMSPVKLEPATPTKRTCVAPLGSLACEPEGGLLEFY